MFILTVYDVRNDRRLRKIAIICEGCGSRVQKSVFEMNINQTEYIELKSKIEREIDPKEDSVRFYKIGKKETCHVDIIGLKANLEISDNNALIF